MKFFSSLFILSAGVSSAVQAPLNSLLKESWGNPWLAGFLIFAIEVVLFGAGLFLFHEDLPSKSQIMETPWFAYLGGLFGCIVVFATLVETKKVGAGVFNGLMITAAILTSLALDHFGLFGLEQHSVNGGRVAGGALMIAGVLLIAFF